MSFLSRLFGGKSGESEETVESAVRKILVIYDDPEAKADGGVGVVGRSAEEVRAIGRRLAKSGGTEMMVATQDAVRQKYPWAATNIEAIWATIPEWQNK
jgi:hypothetical protein